jgi:hypothetical protein
LPDNRQKLQRYKLNKQPSSPGKLKRSLPLKGGSG